MSIETITIGNEILAGFTVNTNAAYIGQKFLESGVKIERHTVLPDEKKALKKGLEEALQRNTLVIATGGLGPTSDDITLEVVAELFDSDFHYDHEIAKDLEQRFGKTLSTIENQATVPSKAITLKNHLGTAPGFLFKTENCTLILLPGVPHEMKAMLKEHVLPLLPKAELHSATLHLVRLFEADVNPYMLQLQQENPDVEIGIYPGIGTLTIRLFAKNEKPLNDLNAKIQKKYRKYIFDTPTIEQAIQDNFIQKGITLSTAESCTGGLVASRLTQVPGASEYYLGTVVSYSNEMKVRTLGVSKETIEKYGAVSEEVVKEMVTGILKLTGSDYAIAVSGVAGPTGGTESKPVGTVWCGIGKKGQPPKAWLRRPLPGNRETIITHSVNELLAELYLEIVS